MVINKVDLKIEDYTVTIPANAAYGNDARPVVATLKGLKVLDDADANPPLIKYNGLVVANGPVDAGEYKVTIDVPANNTNYNGGIIDVGTFTITKRTVTAADFLVGPAAGPFVQAPKAAGTVAAVAADVTAYIGNNLAYTKLVGTPGNAGSAVPVAADPVMTRYFIGVDGNAFPEGLTAPTNTNTGAFHLYVKVPGNKNLNAADAIVLHKFTIGP
jgi:hypothetical protein